LFPPARERIPRTIAKVIYSNVTKVYTLTGRNKPAKSGGENFDSTVLYIDMYLDSPVEKWREISIGEKR
jgi:hypothetical protein